MSEQLREELARLAERAPAAHVDPATWRLGRRARRRDRLTLAAAVVVTLAVVGGGVSLLVPRPAQVAPAAPTGQGEAVPSALHAVPERLVQLRDTPSGELSWAPELDVTGDLAVGVAAAAFEAGSYGGLPVVVSATDGRYLPLDLPGFSDAAIINTDGGGTSALELSPDGRRLAYAWWDPEAPLDRPMPAGVRVVDLVTGSVGTVRLHGGNGVDVDRLSWSPDGEWLAWQGAETRSWTPRSRGGYEPVAGLVRTGSTRSRSVPVPRGVVSALAVDATGRVGFVADPWVVVDGVRTRVAAGGPVTWNAAAFSRDSDLLALSDQSLGTLPLVGVDAGEQRYVPLEGDAVDARVAPLGWTPDGRVLATRDGSDRSDTGSAELALADPGRRSWRVVGEVDPGLLPTLSVATDLVAGDRPTVARPAPDWPWSAEQKAVALALLLLVLLAGAVALGRLTRHRED